MNGLCVLTSGWPLGNERSRLAVPPYWQSPFLLLVEALVPQKLLCVHDSVTLRVADLQKQPSCRGMANREDQQLVLPAKEDDALQPSEVFRVYGTLQIEVPPSNLDTRDIG